MNPWGWQLVNGIWYKREDLYADPVWGVNGSKFRTWQSVIAGQPNGHVVVAGSVHAPTVPAVAVAALQAYKGCTVIVGGTTPEKALRHHYIKIAAEADATIRSVPVGYGPALKAAAREFEANHDNVWNVHPENLDAETFLEPVGQQLRDIPKLRTLIVPLGSGNTTAGILYGLSRYARDLPVEVIFIGIGPDHWDDHVWSLVQRSGAGQIFEDVRMTRIQLHDWFARYSDRMPETLDGITFHPTYEGKVIRYLNTTEPDWWTRRNGSVGFWIVGGPF